MHHLALASREIDLNRSEIMCKCVLSKSSFLTLLFVILTDALMCAVCAHHKDVAVAVGGDFAQQLFYHLNKTIGSRKS